MKQLNEYNDKLKILVKKDLEEFLIDISESLSLEESYNKLYLFKAKIGEYLTNLDCKLDDLVEDISKIRK